MTENGVSTLRLLARVCEGIAVEVEAGRCEVWDNHSDDIEQALGLLLAVVEAGEGLRELKASLRSELGDNYSAGWKEVGSYGK